jgi:hypothetical protein
LVAAPADFVIARSQIGAIGICVRILLLGWYFLARFDTFVVWIVVVIFDKYAISPETRTGRCSAVVQSDYTLPLYTHYTPLYSQTEAALPPCTLCTANHTVHSLYSQPHCALSVQPTTMHPLQHHCATHCRSKIYSRMYSHCTANAHQNTVIVQPMLTMQPCIPLHRHSRATDSGTARWMPAAALLWMESIEAQASGHRIAKVCRYLPSQGR